MRRPRTVVAAAFVATWALLVTSCVQVPDSGPVQAAPEVGSNEEPVLRYIPGGPTPDADKVEIVEGYIDAMRAFPSNPGIVRLFLTDRADARWSPDSGTQIYTERPEVEETGSSGVRIETHLLARLSARGAWSTPPPTEETLAREFRLRKERGQWRVDDPASGLLIPEYDFDRYYRPYSLYFFDPALRRLVPDQVYLPQGDQTATLLLRGLQSGPTDWLRGAVDSFIPVTQDTDTSVPITDEGVAEVQLDAPARGLGAEERELLAAQLSWTLRQVPEVDSVRVTVNGSPLPLEGGSAVDIDGGSNYDPADSAASQALFALRGGQVVTVDWVEGAAQPVAGRFGSGDGSVSAFAVDRTAQTIAAVTHDSTTVEVASVGGDESTTWFDRGRSLLGLQWDVHGLLWAVDRTRSGPAVYVMRNRRWDEVALRGDPPERIQAFALSRDGVRLAVVAGKGASSRLLVGRVRRPADGSLALGIDHWREVSNPQVTLSNFVDVAWSSPTELAVVAEDPPGSRQMSTVSIDGSLVEPSTLVDADVRSVADVPVADLPTVVGTDAGALLVQQSERWSDLELDGRLHSPAYVE
ncbi:MAG: LpqB family beta-propeller domain-containing protein [Nocardioidaceae bacterium]